MGHRGREKEGCRLSPAAPSSARSLRASDLIAVGGVRAEATPLLSREKLNPQHLTISLMLAYHALELNVLRAFFIAGHLNVLANRSVAPKEKRNEIN